MGLRATRPTSSFSRAVQPAPSSAWSRGRGAAANSGPRGAPGSRLAPGRALRENRPLHRLEAVPCSRGPWQLQESLLRSLRTQRPSLRTPQARSSWSPHSPPPAAPRLMVPGPGSSLDTLLCPELPSGPALPAPHPSRRAAAAGDTSPGPSPCCARVLQSHRVTPSAPSAAPVFGAGLATWPETGPPRPDRWRRGGRVGPLAPWEDSAAAARGRRARRKTDPPPPDPRAHPSRNPALRLRGGGAPLSRTHTHTHTGPQHPPSFPAHTQARARLPWAGTLGPAPRHLPGPSPPRAQTQRHRAPGGPLLTRSCLRR